MNNINNSRSDFIDLARGIGIFLVVWGHTMIVRSAYLYSFHLPLFFLISGYLYKKVPFPVFLQNKINRILIPYIFFFLISWLFFLTLILTGFDNASLSRHIRNLPYVFVGIEKDGGNGPIWFLACLFSMAILYSLMDNYIRNRYRFNIIILILTFSGILCLKFNIHLPYRTEIACMSVLFYHIGHWAKKMDLFRSFFKKKWMKWGVIVLLIVIHIVAYTVNIKISGIHNINLIANITGNFYLFYLGALCAIFYVLILSSEIPRINIINYLGQNSLVIMAVHVLILHIFYNKLYYYFSQMNISPFILSLSSVVITLFICLPIISISKKYLPGLTGYKSLLIFNRQDYAYKVSK